MLDSGQRRESFLEGAIQILRTRLVVSGQARIHLEQEIIPGLQPGVDRRGFARAANEERRRGQERERESDLHNHERIAREKLPTSLTGIFSGMFLQVLDHRRFGELQRRPEREGEGAEERKRKRRREHRSAQAAIPNNVHRHHASHGSDEQIRRPKTKQQPERTADQARGRSLR